MAKLLATRHTIKASRIAVSGCIFSYNSRVLPMDITRSCNESYGVFK